MLTNHWLWIYAGVGLMLLELVIPGFILCFFGLAAITVGALTWLIGSSMGLAWQLALFSALSVVYIVLLRRWFSRSLKGEKSADEDLAGEFVGRTGRVTTAIRPPLAGRVMIGDAEWNAVSEASIDVGADVKVTHQNNLTMKVEAI